MHTKPKHLNFCRFCYLTNKKSTYIFCKLHSLKKWASRIQRLPCWEALGWVSLRVAFLNAAYSFFIHPQKPCLRRSCSRAESGKKKKKKEGLRQQRAKQPDTKMCYVLLYITGFQLCWPRVPPAANFTDDSDTLPCIWDGTCGKD